MAALFWDPRTHEQVALVGGPFVWCWHSIFFWVRAQALCLEPENDMSKNSNTTDISAIHHSMEISIQMTQKCPYHILDT